MKMFRQEKVKSQSQPRPRPLWQLLLAEQTGQLPPLTCEECYALLEFLSDLIAEGCDSELVLRRFGHCLAQINKCGWDFLSCPLPAPAINLLEGRPLTCKFNPGQGGRYPGFQTVYEPDKLVLFNKNQARLKTEFASAWPNLGLAEKTRGTDHKPTRRPPSKKRSQSSRP